MFSKNPDVLKNVQEDVLKNIFNACVNVVKSLPKNGDYKPSNETLLTYYANFKQATIGKCNVSKPWAVDVVNRAKWDAWNSLANISKQEAMMRYALDVIKNYENLPSTTEKEALKSLLDALQDKQDKSHGDQSSEQVLNKKIDNESSSNINIVSNETENKLLLKSNSASEVASNCQSDSDDEFLDPNQCLPGEDEHLQDEGLSEKSVNLAKKSESNESVQKEVKHISESKLMQLQKDVLSKLDSLKLTNENITSDLLELKLQISIIKSFIESKKQKQEKRSKKKLNSLAGITFSGFNWTNIFFYILWPLIVSYSINKLSRKF